MHVEEYAAEGSGVKELVAFHGDGGFHAAEQVGHVSGGAQFVGTVEGDHEVKVVRCSPSDHDEESQKESRESIVGSHVERLRYEGCRFVVLLLLIL